LHHRSAVSIKFRKVQMGMGITERHAAKVQNSNEGKCA
jgi:hypothetical protein